MEDRTNICRYVKENVLVPRQDHCNYYLLEGNNNPHQVFYLYKNKYEVRAQNDDHEGEWNTVSKNFCA